jgi:hypothetical protein
MSAAAVSSQVKPEEKGNATNPSNNLTPHHYHPQPTHEVPVVKHEECPLTTQTFQNL